MARPRYWLCTTFLAVPAGVAAACVGADPSSVRDPATDAGDASTEDAVPAGPCRRDLPFGEPVLLAPSVSSPDGNEFGARLSNDLLTIYFSRASSSDAGASVRDLFVARRSSPDAPFGDAIAIDALNTTSSEFWPSLGTNEAELFFSSDRTPPDAGVGGYRDLWVAPLADGVLGTATILAAVSTPLEESAPYVVANGTALYFTRGPSDGDRDLYVSYRNNGDGTFPVGSAVGGDVNRPTTNESEPVLTPDELVLYFKRSPPGSETEGNIFRAQRPSRSDPFPAALPLDELRTVGISQAPSWIAADDCTLLLSARADARAGDIYIARRPAR